VSIEHNFLPVQEYRCTLCGVKLEFFHRKYDEGMIGARHPKRGKCSRRGKAYYVPHIQLSVMAKEFQ